LLQSAPSRHRHRRRRHRNRRPRHHRRRRHRRPKRWSRRAWSSGRAEQALEALALGARLSQRHAEEIAGYWVFIPPQSSRQAANRKAAELKKLGVDDFFIVQEDSKFRYSISLGIFKTEDAAKARLEQLRAKGVRTGRVGARDTTVQKVYFVVREVPDALAAKLNELRQGFPGTELKECQPEAKRGAN
jgi:hypothetical protein